MVEITTFYHTTLICKYNSQSSTLVFHYCVSITQISQAAWLSVVFFNQVKDKAPFLALHGVSSIGRRAAGCSKSTQWEHWEHSSIFLYARPLSFFTHYTSQTIMLWITKSWPWQHLNTAYQRQESALGNDKHYIHIPFSQRICTFWYSNYFRTSR